MEGGKQRMNNQISHLAPGSPIAELLPSARLWPGRAAAVSVLPEPRHSAGRARGCGPCSGAGPAVWALPLPAQPLHGLLTTSPEAPRRNHHLSSPASQAFSLLIASGGAHAHHPLPCSQRLPGWWLPCPRACFLPNAVCPKPHLSLSLVPSKCC